MIKPINNNKYFKFFQPKLFYINNDIDNNDPVRLLSTIAVLKEDMKLRKLKVRGKNSTKREIGVFCIAYNFNKYLAKLSRKKQGVVLHPLKTA